MPDNEQKLGKNQENLDSTSRSLTGRGSERIWRKHMIFWGGVVGIPALIGAVMGETARQVLRFPQETVEFSIMGAGIGVIVVGTGLLYLMKRGIVKL